MLKSNRNVPLVKERESGQNVSDFCLIKSEKKFFKDKKKSKKSKGEEENRE